MCGECSAAVFLFLREKLNITGLVSLSFHLSFITVPFNSIQLWTNAMPAEVNRSHSADINEQCIRPFKKKELEFTRVKQISEEKHSEAGIVTSPVST